MREENEEREKEKSVLWYASYLLTLKMISANLSKHAVQGWMIILIRTINIGTMHINYIRPVPVTLVLVIHCRNLLLGYGIWGRTKGARG